MTLVFNCGNNICHDYYLFFFLLIWKYESLVIDCKEILIEYITYEYRSKIIDVSIKDEINEHDFGAVKLMNIITFLPAGITW